MSPILAEKFGGEAFKVEAGEAKCQRWDWSPRAWSSKGKIYYFLFGNVEIVFFFSKIFFGLSTISYLCI